MRFLTAMAPIVKFSPVNNWPVISIVQRSEFFFRNDSSGARFMLGILYTSREQKQYTLGSTEQKNGINCAT